MLRKAVFILSGNAFGSLMLLVRNLLVARLVSVEDYGIAATFAISMAIVEMASGLGLQQLIVQDKEGDDPDLQAGLQGFNLLRGLFAGLSLFLLAYPIALFLGIPEVTWAYQLLALVPVIRGLEHFDIHRFNRNMHFGPLILTKVLPAFISVLSIWPLYHIFGDFQIMLYSVLLQWVWSIVTGHMVAKRKFRLIFRRDIIRKGFQFGWPLLANNILLFLVFQGDRLIVGHELGLATLAIFSMGITFTLTPTLVSGASEQQFFLPQLAAVRDQRDDFEFLALTAMQTSLIAGILLVLGISIVASPLVTVLLGEKYETLIPLLPWLAIWQAVRTFKVGNSYVSVAHGLTSNAMFANIVRITIGLPLVWAVLLNGGTLFHVILVTIFAETLGYLVSLTLVVRRIHIPLKPMLLPIAISFATLAVVGTVTHPFNNNIIWKLIGGAGALGLGICTLISMSAFRSYAFRRLSNQTNRTNL